MAWPQPVTFQAGVPYPVQKGSTATATADFNGDGKLDLAVANMASSSVSIFLGKGDGTFSAGTPVTLPSNCAVDSLTAADFTGDGKIDLLAVCGFQTTIWVLPGLGTGQFGTPVATNTGLTILEGYLEVSFHTMAVADFNRDGKLDLVLITATTSNATQFNLVLFLGSGSGTFHQSPPNAFVLPSIGNTAVAADFNGDGIPDLAVSMLASGGGTNSTVVLLRGVGDGTFQQAGQFTTQGAVELGTMTVADVNGDGKPDLAIAAGIGTGTDPPVETNVSAYLGNGDFTFRQAASLSEPYQVSELVAANFHGTGTLDLLEELISLGGNNLPLSSISMSVRAGNGDGTFQAATPVALPSGLGPLWFSAAIGDWNGDGLADLAFTAGPASAALDNKNIPAGANAFDGAVALYDALPGGDLVVMLNGLTPPPAIALSATQLQYSGASGGAAPPAQQVKLSNSGGGTLTWTATSSAGWLTVSPQSGSGAATLTISAVPGSLSAGSYTGTVQIAAPGATTQSIAVTLMVTAPSTSPTISGVVNGASFLPGIEAGSWVTITGSNLANTNPGRTWRSDEIVNGNLPTALDGVSVTIDGRPAFVEYISPTQLNVQAPSDAATGAVSVVVTNNGQVSAAVPAQLQTSAPAFFVYGGNNDIATRYPDYALIGNPAAVSGTVAAKPGDILILWATGLGPTSPVTPAGIVVTGAPADAITPVVTVGGLSATVLSAVLSPGSAGLYQVAIQLPASMPSGALAITVAVGGTTSPAGVVLYVGQ